VNQIFPRPGCAQLSAIVALWQRRRLQNLHFKKECSGWLRSSPLENAVIYGPPFRTKNKSAEIVCVRYLSKPLRKPKEFRNGECKNRRIAGEYRGPLQNGEQGPVENSVQELGLMAEHGQSFLISTPGGDILFDTGQGFALIANVSRMEVDLRTISAIVLSHGHRDHTGGAGPGTCRDWRQIRVCPPLRLLAQVLKKDRRASIDWCS
jgi:hypothetical protein